MSGICIACEKVVRKLQEAITCDGCGRWHVQFRLLRGTAILLNCENRVNIMMALNDSGPSGYTSYAGNQTAGTGCPGFPIPNGHLWEKKSWYHLKDTERFLCQEEFYRFQHRLLITCTEDGWKLPQGKDLPNCYPKCQLAGARSDGPTCIEGYYQDGFKKEACIADINRGLLKVEEVPVCVMKGSSDDNKLWIIPIVLLSICVIVLAIIVYKKHCNEQQSKRQLSTERAKNANINRELSDYKDKIVKLEKESSEHKEKHVNLENSKHMVKNLDLKKELTAKKGKNQSWRNKSCPFPETSYPDDISKNHQPEDGRPLSLTDGSQVSLTGNMKQAGSHEECGMVDFQNITRSSELNILDTAANNEELYSDFLSVRDSSEDNYTDKVEQKKLLG